MFYTKLMKQFRSIRIRQLHSTLIKYEDKSAAEAKATNPPKKNILEPQENMLGAPLHVVRNIDRRILVWTKRFPSMDQVPSKVPIDTMQKAHTMARIRVCFIMMGLSIIGFFVSVMIGKREVASGKDLLSERMKWYKKIEEEGKREAEMAKTQ